MAHSKSGKSASAHGGLSVRKVICIAVVVLIAYMLSSLPNPPSNEKQDEKGLVLNPNEKGLVLNPNEKGQKQDEKDQKQDEKDQKQDEKGQKPEEKGQKPEEKGQKQDEKDQKQDEKGQKQDEENKSGMSFLLFCFFCLYDPYHFWVQLLLMHSIMKSMNRLYKRVILLLLSTEKEDVQTCEAREVIVPTASTEKEDVQTCEAREVIVPTAPLPGDDAPDAWKRVWLDEDLYKTEFRKIWRVINYERNTTPDNRMPAVNRLYKQNVIDFYTWAKQNSPNVTDDVIGCFLHSLGVGDIWKDVKETRPIAGMLPIGDDPVAGMVPIDGNPVADMAPWTPTGLVAWHIAVWIPMLFREDEHLLTQPIKGLASDLITEFQSHYITSQLPSPRNLASSGYSQGLQFCIYVFYIATAIFIAFLFFSSYVLKKHNWNWDRYLIGLRRHIRDACNNLSCIYQRLNDVRGAIDGIVIRCSN